MNAFRLSILLLCFSVVASGAEPTPPPIRLPAGASPVVANVTLSLPSEAVFVVECDTPCLVLSSRSGLVSIIEEVGPIRIRARFADGSKVESRTYKAKQVWVIEPLSSGEVEILVVPVGSKDESSVIRRTVVVGSEPVPVPVPPKPQPEPTPPKPVPPTTLGLTGVVREAVLEHVPKEHRHFAQKIAESYREGAKNLSNGTWTTENAFQKQFEQNRKIGYDTAMWSPVFKEVANVLAAASKAGNLTTDKQYVATWAELSIAFAEASR